MNEVLYFCFHYCNIGKILFYCKTRQLCLVVSISFLWNKENNFDNHTYHFSVMIDCLYNIWFLILSNLNIFSIYSGNTLKFPNKSCIFHILSKPRIILKKFYAWLWIFVAFYYFPKNILVSLEIKFFLR